MSQTSVRLAQVGDVITSKKFAYGCRDISDKSKVISIGLSITVIPRPMTKQEIADYVLKNHRYPSNDTIDVDYRADDITRSYAKFVVVQAGYAGGGGAQGGETYDNEWQVFAQKLLPNGTYDPDGEIIVFFMTGSYEGTVDPKDITFVGHMQRKVTFS